jgi:DNA-binding MarR family transcriptional regulator
MLEDANSGRAERRIEGVPNRNLDNVKWLSEREMTAWRALLNTTTGLLATLDQELQAEHGLSLAEYEVLVIAAEHGDDGVRMQDLAGLVRLSPSGATRRIDGMVRRDLVARRTCPSDRRGFNVVLTAHGRRCLETAAPTHVRGVRAHFVDRLTERQLANIASALSAIEIDREAAAGGCDSA